VVRQLVIARKDNALLPYNIGHFLDWLKSGALLEILGTTKHSALLASHRQINASQKLGIQECAMQRPLTGIDLVVSAERIQRIPLSRTLLLCH